MVPSAFLQAAGAAHDATSHSSGFLPHGYCFLWNRSLLATHVISDVLIGLAYVTISLSLALLLRRLRGDIPFSVVFVAFGLFIVSCGLTHFVEVWTFWHPVYWLAGGVKAVTAVASVSTAVMMPFLLPRVRETVRDARLSRSRELEGARAAALAESNAELERMNADLQRALAEAEAARAIAEEASRARSDFLAIMSHELRTPLNAVIGYTELLSLGVPGPVNGAQRDQLGRIQRSANHLIELIDDVLKLSRLEADAEHAALEPVDVARTVAEIATDLRSLADARGLALSVEGADVPLVANTDAQKVRQVVLNLLSNALKYTNEGGVRVRVGRADVDGRPGFAISVTDTGIGIAAEDQERIFEPFWRVGPVRTRSVGGAGLGLSVSQRLAHLLGGRIDVRSEPGRGSTFTFVAPHG